jgi:hypothetical protein
MAKKIEIIEEEPVVEVKKIDLFSADLQRADLNALAAKVNEIIEKLNGC